MLLHLVHIMIVVMEMQTKTSTVQWRYFIALTIMMLIMIDVIANAQTAQKLELGVVGVVANNSVSSNSPNGPPGLQARGLKSGLNLSGGFGLYAQRQLNRKWNVQFDFRYMVSTYANTQSYDVVQEGKYQLRYFQTNLTLGYVPFWRQRVPLSLFGGAILQFRAGYKADLLIADPPRRLAWQWETFNYTDTATQMKSPVAGVQIGVAYPYRNFQFRVSYSQMLTPALQIDRGTWPINYFFASTQFGIGYTFFRR
jgi:hypothetical protein